MRILNCYMANDSKGHFVTAKKKQRSTTAGTFLCCVSCGCPLTLQRGNDGQPPWFEHDQMTVAEKNPCCDAPGLTRQRKRPVVCICRV